jgi:hypothetical protein
MRKIGSDGIGTAGADALDLDAAFETLRGALAEVVDGSGSPSDLRSPLRRLCVFAHSEDLPAEQLLIRFKQLWAGLPQHSGLPRGRQADDLMARIATMCIEEFYGPPRDRDGPAG